MTGFQVALQALNCRPAPRQAVALLAGGEWFVANAGQTFEAIIDHPRAMAGVIIKAFEDLEPDLMWPGGGLLNFPPHYLGAPLAFDGAVTPALGGPAIESLAQTAELKTETVLNHPGQAAIIEAINLTGQAIGDKCLLLPTQWGPLTLASRIRGMDSLMMDMVRDPEGVQSLLKFTTELCWQLALAYTRSDRIPGFNISEPVASGNVISPAFFSRFAAPALGELINRARSEKLLTMLHICGDTTALLPQVAELKPNAYSLETAVNLTGARKILGGKVAVTGNVSPTGELVTGKPEAVISEARACLAAWGEEPGFILANGCDIPKHTPLENLKALMSLKEG